MRKVKPPKRKHEISEYVLFCSKTGKRYEVPASLVNITADSWHGDACGGYSGGYVKLRYRCPGCGKNKEVDLHSW